MAKVQLTEEARREYFEALAWYHARSPRAALGFESAFSEAIERIENAPEQFPQDLESGFRFATLLRSRTA